MQVYMEVFFKKKNNSCQTFHCVVFLINVIISGDFPSANEQKEDFNCDQIPTTVIIY